MHTHKKAIYKFILFFLVIGAGPIIGQDIEAVKKTTGDISFTFAPKTPLTYTVTSTLYKKLEQKDYKKTEEVRDVTSRATITSEVKKGFNHTSPPVYTMVNETLSMAIKQDDKPVMNPLLNIVAGIKSKTIVDHTGKIIRVEGLRTFDETVQQTYPSQIADSLLVGMNSKILEANLRSEWADKIEHFSGKSVDLGDTWTSIQKVSLPSNEPAIYYSEILFSEWVTTQNVKCLKVKIYQHTDPDYLGGLVFEPKTEAPIEIPLREIVVSGYLERWVDPTTMLIYYETFYRTITFPYEDPEAGLMQSVLQEKHTSTFTY